jgi:hypothetical protein
MQEKIGHPVRHREHESVGLNPAWVWRFKVFDNHHVLTGLGEKSLNILHKCPICT